jgi:hypothetical protein
VAIIVVGAAPAPGISNGFNNAYCSTMNAVLSLVEFGNGGHAQFIAQQSEGLSSDLSIRLTLDGHPGHWDSLRSARKYVYLPLLLVVAMVLAAPLPFKRKLGCTLVGAVLSLALSSAALILTAAYSFSSGIPGVYQLGDLGRSALDLAMRTLVMPSSLWKMGPVLLGLILIGSEHLVWEWRRERRIRLATSPAPERARPALTTSRWKPAARKPRRRSRR